jgi:hypothetical protein
MWAGFDHGESTAALPASGEPLMSKKPLEWTYTYFDLMTLTGLSQNAIHQAVARGNLEPGNLESLIVWLSRQAKPALKRKMLRHALYEDADTVANRAKSKRKKGERDV